MAVEVYIILAFLAASVIALCARPSGRGAVRTHLVGGTLLEAESAPGGDVASGVAFNVDERGRLVIFRYGLQGVGVDGAYSLAVDVSGFDVTVNERTLPGRSAVKASCATATLDFLGAERYHIQYKVDATLHTAFYLTLRPGARIDRPLEA